MPELPEVETVKNGIREFIGNSIIENAEVFQRRFREPIPDDFEQKVRNAKIIGYRRFGKYLLVDLDNQYSIIWHLGMSGRIKTLKTYPKILEKHDHVVIKTQNGCLIFNDPRRFGLMLLCLSKDIGDHKLFCKMGLDPFDTNLTPSYLYKKLQRSKTPIKISLLNQEIVNGIGNIYASEILYKSAIIPTRLSLDISLEECDSLIQNTRLVLQNAIDNGGSTLRDYHKPDGSLGYFQNLHCVYNKSGQRCPDCSCDITKTDGIKKIVQGGRSSFYCPVKQK